MSDHSFDGALGLANNAAVLDALEEQYRARWPGLAGCKHVPFSDPRQGLGVDTILKVGEHNVIYIEEKIRTIDYGDFLCEQWSVFRGADRGDNAIGWTLDPAKISHYIAWYVLPTESLTLIPAQLLRWTAQHSAEQWAKQYGTKVATTDGRYETINIPVPWVTLWACMMRESGNERNLSNDVNDGIYHAARAETKDSCAYWCARVMARNSTDGENEYYEALKRYQAALLKLMK